MDVVEISVAVPESVLRQSLNGDDCVLGGNKKLTMTFLLIKCTHWEKIEKSYKF